MKSDFVGFVYRFYFLSALFTFLKIYGIITMMSYLSDKLKFIPEEIFMRRWLAIFLTLICTGCSVKDGALDDAMTTAISYAVEIVGDYSISNELKDSYEAGEIVTIKLETYTEHYYKLYVNGEEQEVNQELSDMDYTYYTFIMPAEAVQIEIMDFSVEIPEN